MIGCRVRQSQPWLQIGAATGETDGALAWVEADGRGGIADQGDAGVNAAELADVGDVHAAGVSHCGPGLVVVVHLQDQRVGVASPERHANSLRKAELRPTNSPGPLDLLAAGRH